MPRPVPLLVLALWITCLSAPAWAQLTPLAEGGARSLALGRATTALADDVWGHHNPASWSTLPGGAVGLYATQLYGLPELRLGALAVAQPTRWGTVAGTARTYGFEQYRETVLGLGYGRAFALSASRRLHAGLHVRYTTVTIEDFGSAGALGLSLGVLAEVVPNVTFGFYAQNLNRPELTDQDPLQTRLDVGLAYRAHERALVLFSVDKDVDYPVSFRGGLEVQPVEVLFLRTGFTTAPARFTGGVGVRLGMAGVGVLAADVSAERHEILGWTPAFGLSVFW